MSYDSQVTTTSNLPKIELRILQLEDLSKFLEIRNAVSEMLHDHRTFTLEECESWFITTSPTYYLVEASDLGVIGYFRWSLPEKQTKKVEIGLDLGLEYQGKKWAKAIYAKFIKEVLKSEGIQEIELRVLKTNVRALNLYTDMGFEVCNETEIDFSMKVDVDEILKKLSPYALSLNL